MAGSWTLRVAAKEAGAGARRGLWTGHGVGLFVLHELERLVDTPPGAVTHDTVGVPLLGHGGLAVEDGRDLASGHATACRAEHRLEFAFVVGCKLGHWSTPAIEEWVTMQSVAELPAESSAMRPRGVVESGS